MKTFIVICSMLILASGGALAQGTSAEKGSKAAREAARAEQDEPSEVRAEKAQRQADRAIGEAANPDRRDAAGHTGDDVKADRESLPKQVDRDDYGNATSQEMLRQRDESKAIKEEYRASGEKQAGKKPWHKAADTGDGDKAAAKGKSGKGKSKSDRSGDREATDDRDHD